MEVEMAAAAGVEPASSCPYNASALRSSLYVENRKLYPLSYTALIASKSNDFEARSLTFCPSLFLLRTLLSYS